MKFQYLGTAAAEGIPALWCTCDACIRSRALGTRAVRTRSQALIDGCLMIDFPADTYKHILDNRLALTDITHCLVTHSHSDHLYPADFAMLAPGFANIGDDYHLTIYGSERVGEAIAANLKAPAAHHRAHFEAVLPFSPFAVGKYTVTALPAIHDPSSGPYFYMISDGEKTVLYAHDTNYFHDDVWAYFAKLHAENKLHFDMVSLDCTNACRPMTYIGHMSLAENAKVRCRMIEEGYADENTIFVCNHFSHNGTSVVYDDFVPIAAKEGFRVSYDGMVLEF